MMLVRKTLIILMMTLAGVKAQSPKNCFIAKENGKIVKQEGDCRERHSPFSTFKIPIALMGFDAGILASQKEPQIDFTKEIQARFGCPNKFPIMQLWCQSQTPATWMKYSVAWYSQEITAKLGLAKFKDYLQRFAYGNADVSGNPGKNDGLINAWLGFSLKISALEQVEFIEKLSNRDLPISKEAQEKTISLIPFEDIWNEWKLYGKTGGGSIGWFVGWIEKGNRRIVFVQYVEPKETLISGGQIAKELAKNQLISVILGNPQKLYASQGLPGLLSDLAYSSSLTIYLFEYNISI